MLAPAPAPEAPIGAFLFSGLYIQEHSSVLGRRCLPLRDCGAFRLEEETGGPFGGVEGIPAWLPAVDGREGKGRMVTSTQFPCLSEPDQGDHQSDC